MIFIDASAIVAILTDEPEGLHLAERIRLSRRRLTSPIASFEATLAIARKQASNPNVAGRVVEEFIRDMAIEVMKVDAEVGDMAVGVHVVYGKGNHPAKLNMGDCFAYACAKLSGAELLYKGEDFDATDLAAAAHMATQPGLATL